MKRDQSKFFHEFPVGMLTLLATLSLSGCSLSARDGDPALSVDLSPLRDRAAQLSLMSGWNHPTLFSVNGNLSFAPTDVSSFKCYGVNVTGPGIADSSSNPSRSALADFERTISEKDRFCSYRGVVTPPLLLSPSESAEASLLVPPGGVRLVQVVGVNDVQICESGVLGRDQQHSGPESSKYFEIGRAVLTDVYSDRSVSITTSWPSENTMMGETLRAQRSIDCDDGVSSPYTVLPTTVSAIASGSFHTCALLGNGIVKCWGRNESGQLGNGSADASAHVTPVEVLGINGLGVLNNVIQIAAGGSHTCALLASHEVVCWGQNEGRLGNGTSNTLVASPVLVSGLSNAIQVAVGGTHTCALRADTGVSCWGAGNLSGQIGDGTTGSSRTSPVTVLSALATPLTGVTQISLGTSHSCAVKDLGMISCWGGGAQFQLGSDANNHAFADSTVSGITNATEVAAGSEHNCAILSGGAVRCWGNGAYGRLGDGTTTSSLGPVSLPGFFGVSSISSGGAFSCATTPGGLYCWGKNASGQLGDGTTTNRSSPASVPGIPSSYIQIASGGEHSCFLNNGIVYCAGFNTNGQLGDGSTTMRVSPTPVLF